MSYSGHVSRYETSKGQTRWMYVIEMGKGYKVNRKQTRKRGFITKKEAQAALTKQLHELNAGTYVKPSPIRLEEHMALWLEKKKKDLKPSTYQNYTSNLETHILPALGHMQLREVRMRDIEKFYDDLQDKHGLASATVKKIHNMLSNAFEYAMKLEILVKNPVRLVDTPKERRVETQVWTVEERNTFLKAAAGSNHYMVYLIALDTGMRMGEILGLKWKNVNLEKRLIYVVETQVKEATDDNSPKTKAGQRVVNITKQLAEALRKHREQQLLNIEKEKQKAKKKGKPKIKENVQEGERLVVSGRGGVPINPSNLRRSFYETIEMAGVKRIRFHDLRHTHATHLMEKNVPVKIVSERLGHTSTRMTIDRYSHLLPSMQEDAVKKLEELLYGDQDE